MKRSTLIKFLIPLTLGILFFSFTSTAHAARDTITFRPLSHWTFWNPGVIYGWSGHEPGLGHEPDFGPGWYGIFFSFWWNDPPFSPLYPEPSWYDGYIQERELPDGRAEITIYIDFHDWVIRYGRAFPDPHPYWAWYQMNIFNEDLTMSGRAITKFILPSPNEWYPHLPNFWYMLAFEVGEIVSISITATGFGTFSDYAVTKGFTPGATAKVTLVQGNLCNPPVADPIDGMWPVEIISIKEMK